MIHPLQHEITLDLATGARLWLGYFSDRELRWIFSYDYVSPKRFNEPPDIFNKTRLVANYADGRLANNFALSMHVVIPSRLGRQFFMGLDISSGAKTYLEFCYSRSFDEYKLTEICKGAGDRLRLDAAEPAILRPVAFPFPVPDRLPVKCGRLQVPFRTNADGLNYFDLPERTLR